MPQGPLQGVKLVEFSGIGPAPFATMLLSDMGAEVIRIDKPGKSGFERPDDQSREILARGRRTLGLDLRQPKAVEACLHLLKQADILIEGYRPGVMERLGLGPDEVLKANPGLVYGRMTGWGQHGPLAHSAGHDINYIALTGALHGIGPRDKPMPAHNVIGDFGGGSLYLVMGVLAAMHHARKTGEGQVVDAAIVDGTVSLMTAIHQIEAMGLQSDQREDNWLDGGAPFYRCYECADDQFISIGPLEPQFFQLLLDKLGLSKEPSAQNPFDKSTWPDLQGRFETVFKSKTRDEWCDILEGSDVCFAPVLSLSESRAHPHLEARQSYVERDGVVQTAPAPRFSKTPGAIQDAHSMSMENNQKILSDWGVTPDQIKALKQVGALG